MKITKTHIFGIGIGLLLVLLDLIFFLNEEDKSTFLFIMGIVITIVSLPFIASLILEGKKDQEISEMFLEFSRNLAESVATGTPISKSIINMRNKNYGALSSNIQKLANQISIGIPVSKALEIFANDVNNPVISRAVSLISEAEKAGGEIDYILESTAKSISEVERLKKEKKAAVQNIVVQGYIIFFIFVGIMLIIEFKILPLTEGLSNMQGSGINLFGNSNPTNYGTNGNVNPAETKKPESINPMLFLLVFQGLFAGLVIGKVTEGSLKSGIRHSFILTITSFLISTGARVVFGSPGGG
jgi:archaeal flagellar protein FlaJ